MGFKHIILVEDDLLFRQSLESLLGQAGYRVTGLPNAEELISLVRQPSWNPDAVCILMDVKLGGLDGLAAQALLRQIAPRLPVIFMSGDVSPQNVNQAWREGACNFLFKPFQPRELLDSLIEAFARHAGPGQAHEAPTALPAAAEGLRQRWLALTHRQRQILPLLAQGLTHAQIAGEVGISARTVKMHRAAIMQRLGLAHVTDLVRFHEACKQGLDAQSA